MFRITPCNGVYICRVCRDVSWRLLCCFQSFSLITLFKEPPPRPPHSPNPPTPVASLLSLSPPSPPSLHFWHEDSGMRMVGIPCLFCVPIAPSRVLGLCSGLDSQAPRLCGQLSQACQHVSKKASAWASPVPLRSGTTPCDCPLSQPAASCLVTSGHQPAAPLRLLLF